jgi:formylmethanofuran dehydrogenase subunit A
VPYFDITPAEIMTGLMQANEFLGLPHSMHVHQNSLGNPGNYTVTLDSLKLAEKIKPNNKFGRDTVLHSTHLQFHSYGGDNWGNFESKSKEVMDYVNRQKNITIDTGCVTLDETTTMTADGPFEHHLTELNHLKWANIDVELETGSGVVPYVYSPDIKVCEIQWAIGLEIALLTKDHMRTFITTDHPNAGPFIRYPRIIKWLMSAEARKERIDSFKHSAKMIDATLIAGMDREISLYELAQMTRAGPAKALGLANLYGGLAPGMDGDVVVYNFNPEKDHKPDEIEKAFSAAAFVLKRGTPVVVDGEIVSNGNKRTLWVDAKTDENPQVMRDIRDKFLRYYSINMNNYEVAGHFLTNPMAIEVDATR